MVTLSSLDPEEVSNFSNFKTQLPSSPSPLNLATFLYFDFIALTALVLEGASPKKMFLVKK